MPEGNALFDIDPRSTMPINDQQQRWVTLFAQLLCTEGLNLDDPRITPLDHLIRCVDHFVFTLAREKRAYRDPTGKLACPSYIFRVLITAYRETATRQSALCKKEHYFTIFHETLVRSHYTLE
jgi:hypothetical protein